MSWLYDLTEDMSNDGCMNPHNAPDCYVQQLHAFRLSQQIPMLNLIKNRIIMFVLIILNDNYQYIYFVYVFLSNKQVPSILPY